MTRRQFEVMANDLNDLIFLLKELVTEVRLLRKKKRPSERVRV